MKFFRSKGSSEKAASIKERSPSQPNAMSALRKYTQGRWRSGAAGTTGMSSFVGRHEGLDEAPAFPAGRRWIHSARGSFSGDYDGAHRMELDRPQSANGEYLGRKHRLTLAHDTAFEQSRLHDGVARNIDATSDSGYGSTGPASSLHSRAQNEGKPWKTQRRSSPLQQVTRSNETPKMSVCQDGEADAMPKADTGAALGEMTASRDYFPPPASAAEPTQTIMSPHPRTASAELELEALEGFKVNKRGRVLDEEGEVIGELSDGDIIDCVRQRVNARGEVTDGHGGLLGHVRLVRRPASSGEGSSTTPLLNKEQSARQWPPAMINHLPISQTTLHIPPPNGDHSSHGGYGDHYVGQPDYVNFNPATAPREVAPLDSGNEANRAELDDTGTSPGRNSPVFDLSEVFLPPLIPSRSPRRLTNDDLMVLPPRSRSDEGDTPRTRSRSPPPAHEGAEGVTIRRWASRRLEGEPEGEPQRDQTPSGPMGEQKRSEQGTQSQEEPETPSSSPPSPIPAPRSQSPTLPTEYPDALLPDRSPSVCLAPQQSVRQTNGAVQNQPQEMRSTRSTPLPFTKQTEALPQEDTLADDASQEDALPDLPAFPKSPEHRSSHPTLRNNTRPPSTTSNLTESTAPLSAPRVPPVGRTFKSRLPVPSPPPKATRNPNPTRPAPDVRSPSLHAHQPIVKSPLSTHSKHAVTFPPTASPPQPNPPHTAITPANADKLLPATHRPPRPSSPQSIRSTKSASMDTPRRRFVSSPAGATPGAQGRASGAVQRPGSAAGGGGKARDEDGERAGGPGAGSRGSDAAPARRKSWFRISFGGGKKG